MYRSGKEKPTVGVEGNWSVNLTVKYIGLRQPGELDRLSFESWLFFTSCVPSDNYYPLSFLISKMRIIILSLGLNAVT